jgi:hypothetical protein
VTLVLRDFPGVAYTIGSSEDHNIKEIHFSLSYIAGTTRLKDPRAELLGVLTHELVHCYQHTVPLDFLGTPNHERSIGPPRPPSGLVEGIADFVRLKAGFFPPHWRRPSRSADLPPSWDAGYQRTAFFLEWLEDVHVKPGAIGMLNDRLLRTGYVGEGPDEKTGENNREQGFWTGLFGIGVLDLWKRYAEYLDGNTRAESLPCERT